MKRRPWLLASGSDSTCLSKGANLITRAARPVAGGWRRGPGDGPDSSRGRCRLRSGRHRGYRPARPSGGHASEALTLGPLASPVAPRVPASDALSLYESPRGRLSAPTSSSISGQWMPAPRRLAYAARDHDDGGSVGVAGWRRRGP